MIEQELQPRLGCAALVVKDNALLLGKRKKERNYGMWVIPGGGVKFGETLEQTAKRELREEAGIEIDSVVVWKPFEIVNPPEHRVIIYMTARYLRGDLRASDDLSEIRFMTREEIALIRDQISPFVCRVLEEAGWLDKLTV